MEIYGNVCQLLHVLHVNHNFLHAMHAVYHVLHVNHNFLRAMHAMLRNLHERKRHAILLQHTKVGGLCAAALRRAA